MRPEDFRPDDLSAQIQGLLDGLAAERAAREAAEAVNKAKSDLVAMIGHELRAPLEAVVAMAELLRSSPLDPTQARYADTLYQSARSLLGALSDVLDYTRLEAGRLELEQTTFDLHDLIQGVGAVLRTRANEKGLTGHRRRRSAPAPDPFEPDRQRAQIHRARLSAPPCQRH